MAVKTVTVETAVWEDARKQAARDRLPIAGALAALLTAYVSDTITITPPAYTHGRDRGRWTADIDPAVWQNADAARKKTTLRSMSALCELLLRGYTAGTVTIAITAAGHARDEADQPTHNEEAAA